MLRASVNKPFVSKRDDRKQHRHNIQHPGFCSAGEEHLPQICQGAGIAESAYRLGYGLNDLRVRVQSLVRAGDFYLFPEAQPSLYTLGTGGRFLGGKAAEA
jgi:hypothetical protein